ncbi:hypothetical protein PCA20602_02044 [Pandoraea capi]|uniref:Class I SAM-dependent methyltransferase n=1 Tax=Pandoraea capi TaxID=2508286 RepID=A0ABY6VZG0_9BURK|nr:hypothetical protein [Pandoraea capi]VVD99178.1 hypothetical protein PCA20602_02044 [Pandoraea capi]
MTSYTQSVKNKARHIVISNAISALTKNRTSSTLTPRSYVRAVKDHILNAKNPLDTKVANNLSNSTIERWESFYDSIIQSRTAANLKIAYLSGPNPENDLRVFCEAGVLPENIWAFESENSTYSEAVVSALSSEFPFIKIINGGLDAFVEASPQRFDIIYLDFCGPLPNRNKKQKTLTALTRVLAKHSLNSPGVLITNFSLPTEEQDSNGRMLLAKLVACYLYPKSFIEGEDSEHDFSEGPVALGLDPDQWYEMVLSNLDHYYSQFVTRLLMDHASLISPYNRFPKNNSLFGKFFDIKDDPLLKKKLENLFHFNETQEDEIGGDVIADSGEYPLLWTLAALDKGLNKKDSNYPQFVFTDEEFAKFADLFISQLDIDGNKKNLIDSLMRLSFLLSEGRDQENFLSERFKSMYKSHKFSDFHQFCDLVLFHQSIEALFRQVATPYHVNIEKTLRWSYKAKDTPMFMDMIILDECRYLYDWMPTVDMFSEAIKNPERQLAYRFALDGVAKHHRWYNAEYFSGTAIVDQFTNGFKAKTLQPRQMIEDDL